MEIKDLFTNTYRNILFVVVGIILLLSFMSWWKPNSPLLNIIRRTVEAENERTITELSNSKDSYIEANKGYEKLLKDSETEKNRLNKEIEFLKNKPKPIIPEGHNELQKYLNSLGYAVRIMDCK